MRYGYGQAMAALREGEEVLYATTPDMGQFWRLIGCGAILGFFFFFIPGVIIIVVGFIQREKFKDAECLVTNNRIIVLSWGASRRMVEFEHQDVASVTHSGGMFGNSVTIRGNDGRRVKLSNVQYGWELAEVAQNAITASKTP